MIEFRNKFSALILSIFLIIGMGACTDDLDTVPLDEDELVSEHVYGSDLGAYTESLAKIYAGLAISGNSGGDGEQDVAGVEAGSQASFLRGLWNLQELPTDEAHCCWGDAGIPSLDYITWGSGNVFIKGFYYRLYYQVNLANAFLRETTDAKLSDRGVDDDTKSTIATYRAEARFQRALAYYYLLDMFSNVPFVDENSTVGKDAPSQKSASEIFEYIESELIDCEPDMLDPFYGYDSEKYGHASKAANWALLSRLYLNAEVYIGKSKYSECITWCNKILDGNYSLEPVYINMFKADNENSNEMIFPIRYEGEETQTWGGMTFIICSTVPSSMQTEVNSVGAWQGNRARASILDRFKAESDYDNDSRYEMFQLDKTASVEINEVSSYTDNGIPVVKFYNRNSDGTLPASNIMYTDFPLFRLGEIYLNYAEAVLRGGSGGSKATALELIKELRQRAYANDELASISQSDLTLDFIFEERGRELLFEAQRRTDLIRFDKFTGSSYIWRWKGNVESGRAVDDHFSVYPIPADDIGSNPNLTQNDGY
jgi:hypothetical protein